MHAIRIHLALLTLACIAAPAFAQGKTVVNEVVLVGNKKVSSDKAMQFIGTRPGRDFSATQVQDDVLRLAEAKLFRSVAAKFDGPADGRVVVIFEVREHANIVREVVFTNLERITPHELENVTGLQRGMPLDPAKNKAARYEILDHLKKRGHYFAKVTLMEGQSEEDERVVFRIDEGPKVRVRNVQIVGHGDWIAADALAAQLDTRKSYIHAWGDYYRPDAVETDEAKLLTLCRHHGFLDAIAYHRLNWSEDFAHVDVTFHLKQGERYRVGDWEIRTTGKLPRADMLKLVKLKQGDFCVAEAVRADQQRVADWGGIQGKNLRIRHNISAIPDNPGHVRVVYEVEDAPVDYIGEVILVGNSVTKDQVIRRELDLSPGMVLDYTKVRKAQENLMRRGLFHVDPVKGIYPTVTVLDNPGKFKDILVKVEETRTGSLTLGWGFNTHTGPTCGLVLEERNFDLLRLPTNWTDFEEGRAFRGAGHRLRVDFGRMTLSFTPAPSE